MALRSDSILAPVAIAIAFACGAQNAQTPKQQYKIDVVQSSTDPAVLEVTISNTSARALQFYEHALPWVGQYSITLMAAQTDNLGTALKRQFILQDPSPCSITLAPKETIKGEIRLTREFPDLDHARTNRDVVLFWSYRLRLKDGSMLQREGGWFLLEKKGVGG